MVAELPGGTEWLNGLSFSFDFDVDGTLLLDYCSWFCLEQEIYSYCYVLRQFNACGVQSTLILILLDRSFVV